MTIKDLSAQTGYSVGTISRVLNNHPNVSAKARDVILRAVADSGFRLNANAKQLKQQHGNCVLAVIKGTSNELFFGLVEAIQRHFSRLRYPLILDYLDEDANEVARGVQLCAEKKPLGIFFLGGDRENFRRDFSRIDVPCVLVTNSAQGLDFPNLSSVSTDDFRAAAGAMEALLGLGHRDVAIIGGKNDSSDTSRLRYNGCLKALRDWGVAFDPGVSFVSGRSSYQDGYNGTMTLLHSGRRFTAIFAVADEVAIGVIRALRENGLRVPEDVSVMGFGGLPLGDYLVPQLSTVTQSVALLADRSVAVLLDCIENGGAARYETVPYSIRLRESTRQMEP